MTHIYYHDDELGNGDYEAGSISPRIDENAEGDGFPLSDKNSHLRLHEIEEQLQMAETRCNTLKGHLEHMKNVYHKSSTSDGPRKSTHTETPNTSYLEAIYKDDTLSEKVSFASTPSMEPSRDQPKPIRQSSHVISTDTTGAAVLTINHILTGITESVNRLSQLHSHLGPNERKYSPITRSFQSRTGSAFGERSLTAPPEKEEVQIPERLTETESPDQCLKMKKTKVSNITLLDELTAKDPIVQIKSKMNMKRKTKRSRHPSTSGGNTATYFSPAKRSNGKERKVQISPARTNTGLVKSTSTVNNRTPIKKRRMKRYQQPTAISRNLTPLEKNKTNKNILANEKLIELYHNISIKESDSGESNTANGVGKSTAFAKAHSQKNIQDIVVPPLRINSSVKREITSAANNRKGVSDKDPTYLTPIEETDYSEPTAPRMYGSNYCSTYDKSYRLPTIASRLKQVAKSYLNSFNFRAIPFCAAKSITPSHNIGINIQQVMSIIKTRHPINGLSPTLAHNIGLAAEKLNSRPLHAFVSTLSSGAGYTKNCPLTKSQMNYQMLQEIAKDEPDDQVTGVDLKTDNELGFHESDTRPATRDHMMSQRNLISDKTQMIWSRNETEQDCTCVNAEGEPFQNVYHKYSKYGMFSTPYSQIQHNTPMSQPSVPKYTVHKPRSKIISRTSNKLKRPITPVMNESTSMVDKRQKSLKEVLQNLHDDFDTMNKKYEDLRRASNNSDDPGEEMLKELEKMENELNNKEEEINMVLNLYKEITALKDQVKVLKKKASTTTVSTAKVITGTGKTFTEPQTAIHLSKLLRGVQNFQQHYKVKASGKKG